MWGSVVKKIPLLRLRPIILSVIVMVLLALAWLPTGEFAPGDRTNKAQLYVSYEQTGDRQLDDVLFDVQQRIEQRHEWRLVDAPAAYAWQLTVSIEQAQQLVINGSLLTPTTASEQRFRVQGPIGTQGALPEQFVKVLIDLVENGETSRAGL